MYVNDLESARDFCVKYLGDRPRTTGDGYYESCVVVFEGNRIELTE